MPFIIREASIDDAEEMSKIYIAAHVNDDIWKYIVANVTPEDHLAWLTAQTQLRADSPERKQYVVIDTETSKMVAYASLHSPWTFKPGEKASDKRAPLPLGISDELMKEFFTILTATQDPIYHYDPEKHFRNSPSHLPSSPPLRKFNFNTNEKKDRKGITVHPEYQRKGIGKMMCLYMNEIADKAGAKTYVAARPNSLGLLRATGYVVLGEMKVDMIKYGGGEEDGRCWVMVREPQSAA